MPYETILYEKRGRIAYITLNRPEVLNAQNNILARELEDATEDFDKDEEVWVAIVTGAGRAFSAGRDIKVFKAEMEGDHSSGPGRRKGLRPSGLL